MKNRMFKTAAAVPSLKVADPEYNTDQIIALIRENPDCGLIVFPELCITGYTCQDLFQQDILLNRSEECLSRIAQATENTDQTVCVGLPVRFENRLYNCAAIVSSGEIAALVPKVNIPNYSEFYEQRWFASGKDVIGRTIMIADQEVPFGIDILAYDRVHDVMLGAEICEDLWVPDKPSTHLCLAGADIIVNLSASDEIIGKHEYRSMMVQQQSSCCWCGYLYVSSGTDESSTDLVFSGHTMIAENGRILADHVFPKRNQVTAALIDVETIRYNRAHQNTYASADSSWYRRVDITMAPAGGSDEISAAELKAVLQKESYRVPRNPFVPKDDAERGRRCRRIMQIQANGLATRVRSTGIRNLVIGISGGLDSTLALLVCHEAQKIEKDIHIIGYTMPSEGNTTSLTYNNALNLMKTLNVEMHEVPIGSGVTDHLKQIGHSGVYQGEGDTTYENAQARMRTYILMDAANLHNGLVVGTGDLSELALGWCTYNGDHMSMYGVNASVPKTLVQYICRSYAETCGSEDLRNTLLSIVDTPITPELTPNQDGQIAQKTEEKIGKYDLNDFFLFYVLRYGFAPAKIFAFASYAYDDVDEQIIRESLVRFYNRFFHQQFKRSCLPDGPKVGSVTLSPRGDWRMPSDASVQLWLEEAESL